MHQLRRPNDLPSERLPDRLMAEANTEDRDLPREGSDDIQADSGFGRSLRTWRDHDFLWSLFCNRLHGGLVVANDLRIRA